MKFFILSAVVCNNVANGSDNVKALTIVNEAANNAVNEVVKSVEDTTTKLTATYEATIGAFQKTIENINLRIRQNLNTAETLIKQGFEANAVDVLAKINKATDKAAVYVTDTKAKIIAGMSKFDADVQASINNTNLKFEYIQKELGAITAIVGSCAGIAEGKVGVCAQFNQEVVDGFTKALNFDQNVQTFITKLGNKMEQLKQGSIKALAATGEAKKKEFVDQTLTVYHQLQVDTSAFTNAELAEFKKICVTIEKYLTAPVAPDAAPVVATEEVAEEVAEVPKTLRRLTTTNGDEVSNGDEVCKALKNVNGETNLKQASNYLGQVLKATEQPDLKTCGAANLMFGALFAVVGVLLL